MSFDSPRRALCRGRSRLENGTGERTRRAKTSFNRGDGVSPRLTVNLSARIPNLLPTARTGASRKWPKPHAFVTSATVRHLSVSKIPLPAAATGNLPRPCGPARSPDVWRVCRDKCRN
ncbi:unnamed protein product [Prorocentrum cordatum]|uniref:Uncharacterized protein n=1 Tax=Prorocentrum cordatum TaxID=2364126 RepID=A0ABN9QUS6_9DINO|nr:unnamed protein product [Polarella glacialis]